MNKSDLKNGMNFIMRNGEKRFIINDGVYGKGGGWDDHQLRLYDTLDEHKDKYREDFTRIDNVTFHRKLDIMKIYDCNNNLIWERDEIDWSKIPSDTKVYVRQNQEDGWELRYFTKYENNKFYTYSNTYSNGRTFWSDGFVDLEKWNYCELAENPKKEITKNELQEKFDNFCRNCHECKYSKTELDCKLCWILDNYNLTEK